MKTAPDPRAPAPPPLPSDARVALAPEEGPAALGRQFIDFALEAGVLQLGSFKTKAGRMSPYFFNAGFFDDGAKLSGLANYYARAIVAQGLDFDIIFGPAYKGIVLASALAVELARMGLNKPFAYNRKEAKDHGEGGSLVGAPLRGRVLIVDDVISAGVAVRHSVELITAAGAQPHALIVALDRQEKALFEGRMSEQSALEHVKKNMGLQVCAVAKLQDLIKVLKNSEKFATHYDNIASYLKLYGAVETTP